MGSATVAPQTFPAYNQNSQINSAYGTGTAAPQISTDELQVSHFRIQRTIQWALVSSIESLRDCHWLLVDNFLLCLSSIDSRPYQFFVSFLFFVFHFHLFRVYSCVYSRSSIINFFVWHACVQRRQEELERKAQELEKREEQLRNSEAGIRRNNWPPLPAQCCFQPCFYQDINVEIPTEFQRIVRRLYYLWIFYAMVLVSNAFTAFFLLFRENNYGMSHFILGLIYGALFTPASFLCWYVMHSNYSYNNNNSEIDFNF